MTGLFKSSFLRIFLPLCNLEKMRFNFNFRTILKNGDFESVCEIDDRGRGQYSQDLYFFRRSGENERTVNGNFKKLHYASVMCSTASPVSTVLS